ncbi:MAG: flagellar motor switch protein FliM [Oscillospiraceae bacterium]|nr:flagellar motor switch protein FliM [Oscillospiraceae bacterium]
MSDVLSQAEIDALLSKFDAGEMEIETDNANSGLKVKGYDFRTANRFHKEQIRTLEILYDTFARLLSNYLSGTMRVMATADVVGIEELKYQEFINALPAPVILAILRQPPLIGPILFEISPDIAYSMISRLLGGQPSISAGNAREFTEIELVLVERILRQFMPLFVEGWSKVIKTSISLDRIETSPQFAQIVASNETVAIVSINVKLADTEGMVNVCLPHLALEPVSNQLTTKFMYQSGETSKKQEELERDREDIKTRIERTPLDVTAVFNTTSAMVRDVLGLAVGDVLRLDHALAEPMTVMVGHLPKFKASLGIKEKRYAVKISDVLKEDINE